MRCSVALVFAAGLSCGGALQNEHGVSGIERVINLLEDLKDDIEHEGKEEHETYDEFACFCKDKTEDKSERIEESEETINGLSADIQDNSATREQKRSQLAKRKKKDEEMKADLQDEVTRCEKEATRFQYNIADFEKALKSIEGAKEALTGSKGESLVKLHQVVKKTVAEADALSLISEKDGKTLHNFLQSPAFLQGTVDPKDPGYKFHSQPLIDLLDKIHKNYEDKKEEVEKNFEAEQEKCSERKTALVDELEENHDKITELEEDIDELTTKISSDREDLASEEKTLKEDSSYLKDLTERCSKAANEYDQRAAMRDGELSALSKALGIMKNKVKDWDEEADDEEESELQLPRPALRKVVSTKVSLLQRVSVRSQATGFLSRLSVINTGDRQQKALQMLSKEAGRLNSVVLTSLAMQLDRPDPFVKVKSMIQKLIERLLNEAKTEAAHKGFCDEAVGKAKHDRDYRYEDIEELHVRLGDLKSTKHRLNREIKGLKKDLKDLEEALAEANKLRDEEKAENIDTLLKAKKAVAAVKEATLILRTFYHSAKHHDFQGAKPGEVLTALQEDPSFNKGSNRGNQDAGAGVIKAMVELQENFEAKIKEVTTDEKTAAADHEEFSRTTKADIGGKETKLERDEQDLKATIQKLDQAIRDLDQQSTLLDKALKELHDIKPMCFDNGMSVKDREKKREEELAALKMALCILDPNGKEDDCKKEEE